MVVGNVPTLKLRTSCRQNRQDQQLYLFFTGYLAWLRAGVESWQKLSTRLLFSFQRQQATIFEVVKNDFYDRIIVPA